METHTRLNNGPSSKPELVGGKKESKTVEHLNSET